MAVATLGFFKPINKSFRRVNFLQRKPIRVPLMQIYRKNPHAPSIASNPSMSNCTPLKSSYQSFLTLLVRRAPRRENIFQKKPMNVNLPRGTNFDHRKRTELEKMGKLTIIPILCLCPIHLPMVIPMAILLTPVCTWVLDRDRILLKNANKNLLRLICDPSPTTKPIHHN